jgi:hypothetical protein
VLVAWFDTSRLTNKLTNYQPTNQPTISLYGAESFLRSLYSLGQSKNSRKSKVHCHVQTSCLPVPIINQMDTFHSLKHYFSKIILILSFHLRLGLLSSFFQSGFPRKILHAFLIFFMRATYSSYLISLDSTGQTQSACLQQWPLSLADHCCDALLNDE